MSDESTTHDDHAVSDEPIGPSDLEALIAAAFEQGDPVPASVGGPMPYVAWRSPDATIALIVDEDDEVLAVRGLAGATAITFASDTHRITIEIDRSRIAGTISPWAGGTAAIEVDGASVPITVDDLGDFAGRVPGRIARLRFDTGSSVVVSDLFLVSPDPDS